MFNEMNQWLLERCGKFTSSEVYKLIPNGRAKGEKFSQTGKTYIKQKAAEFITKEPMQRPTTFAMEWGLSNENEALNQFEKIYGEIERFGTTNPKFFKSSDFFGGTPDAVLKDYVLEVKCPFNSENHLDHLLLETAEDLKEYSPDYYWQLVSNMVIMEKQKAMFISYDPRFPFDLTLKVLKFDLVQEDADLLISKIEAASEILSEITSKIYESSKAIKENASSIQ